MNWRLRSSLATALVFAVGVVIAGPIQQEQLPQIRPAPPGTPESALMASAAVILSHEDLARYLSSTRPANNAFAVLSDGGRGEFFASLRFNENGLTTFSTRPLENELTPTQIYKVLSLFGAQRLTKLMSNARIETDLDRYILEGLGREKYFNSDLDYQNYRCIERGTCEQSSPHICMSSC